MSLLFVPLESVVREESDVRPIDDYYKCLLSTNTIITEHRTIVNWFSYEQLCLLGCYAVWLL
jgi:hypothetical protein